MVQVVEVAVYIFYKYQKVTGSDSEPYAMLKPQIRDLWGMNGVEVCGSIGF